MARLKRESGSPKIKYTDGEIGNFEVVKDFLPAPGELARREVRLNPAGNKLPASHSYRRSNGAHARPAAVSASVLASARLKSPFRKVRSRFWATVRWEPGINRFHLFRRVNLVLIPGGLIGVIAIRGRF